MFNKFFANQCSLIVNESTLAGHIPVPPNFFLDNIIISDNDILKSIRCLDPNKSHGFDGISIRMLQLCDNSIIKPLSIIFNNCITEGYFPLLWKKGNIIPIHKKGSKQEITNYRPISLLPIFSKIFERIIFNALYNYIHQNNYFNPNQSGFRSGDSYIHQLISITHGIHKTFDENLSKEVLGLVLDISKAFDRVWHDGLLYKLKCMGFEGNAMSVIQSFLENRYQRVILNGQSSNWEIITAGVPQGSILGPLLFLVYINDISFDLECNVKLFADDTCLFSTINDPRLSVSALNNDLSKIQQCADQWKKKFNPDVSKQAQEDLFSKKSSNIPHPNLYFNGAVVQK